MKKAVFIHIDALWHTEEQNGSIKYRINEDLLEQLRLAGQIDLYILTPNWQKSAENDNKLAAALKDSFVFRTIPAEHEHSGMVEYILKFMPDLKRILYFGGNENRLKEIFSEKLPSIHVSTCSVSLINLVSDKQRTSELANYNNAIEHYDPCSMKTKIKNVCEQYKSYTQKNCKWSIFHRHGEDGISRAFMFLSHIHSCPSHKIPGQVFIYLRNPIHGNTHPHSFRTMLLASMLGRPLTNDSLKNVSNNFEELSVTYKNYALKCQVEMNPNPNPNSETSVGSDVDDIDEEEVVDQDNPFPN